jgi:AcrR family transcriptional regulator
MNAEMFGRTIQMILAPVVMITACGLVLSGLWSHFTSINERLRAMTRERLELLRSHATQAMGASTRTDPVSIERIREIDTEAPELLARHKRVQEAVMAIYGAILIFVASMFVIATAVVVDAAAITTLALLLFLGGTAALLFGVVLILVEVRTSHRTIDYEVGRVLSLRGQ